MGFRYEQAMARKERAPIEKSERGVILKDDGTGYFMPDDLTKTTGMLCCRCQRVFHRSSSLIGPSVVLDSDTAPSALPQSSHPLAACRSRERRPAAEIAGHIPALLPLFQRYE